MKNLLVAGLILAGFVTPAVAADVLPLAEVRPGMHGVGVTVFEGTTREEFDVEIIGILHNINGPKRNLILARLDGGPLADTGVIAGMSGSPVYVDGRLVGAVAYAMGSFTTEPLAGITPIEEMLDAVNLPGVRP
ncbi:MAG TPA: SpoIVB peptidase S55, partial [Acidobacteria bacterium]|nr:SpoIVB peptidase S55 [Acidobacteriota bacterium]